MENESLYFAIGKNKISYSSLLEMLENETFSQNFTNYTVVKYSDCYIIKKNKNQICVFKNIIEINIIFKDKKKKAEIFNIHSSLDLENICKKKNISINNLIFYETRNIYNPIILMNYINNNKIIFELKEKEKLPEISSLPLFIKGHSYLVKEYSSFYSYYFKDNLDPNSNFFYTENKVRQKIFYNLLTVHLIKKTIKTFKFTGPFSIGKSITLLQYCRTAGNAFYLNIKLLKNLSEIISYSILREEFARITHDYFDDIQNLIKSYYNDGIDPLMAIVKIMNYLSEKSKNNFDFLFVFDQYKKKIF